MLKLDQMQMERTYKSLLNNCEHPTLNSFNQQTNKIAQSIKSVFVNMVNPAQQPPPLNSEPEPGRTTDDQNFEWPDSFYQLLNSLSLKQSSASSNSQITAQNTCDSSSSATRSSPISSFAADDRDFELLAIEFDDDDDDHDYDLNNNNTVARDNNSVWLMNFEPQNNELELNTDANNNNDRNIVNLMKFLSESNTSKPTSNKHLSLVHQNHDPLSLLTHSLPPRVHNAHHRYHFNQITSIELDYHSVNPPAMMLAFEQDFDDDDDDDAVDEEEEENDADHGDDGATAHEQGREQDHLSAVSSQTEQRRAGGDQAKADDGKYSLLQFALYNFREAIDKYSLESRAGRAAAQTAGDTTTLRGSLKLIETLRKSRNNNNNSEHNHSGSNQNGTKERKSLLVPSNADQSGDWTWRELAEMVKFTTSLPRQSLLKLPSDELNKRAVDCFLAIMQYMGDVPANAKPHQLVPGGEVECVYLILINCHNYPQLREEIYCQLMKQTTNNRSQQPDSCLRGWRLFSIVAAYFDCSPSFKPYLLKYLETAAFDKRRAYCSVAALCLQNLRKTFKYSGRKNVPSIEEIAATSAGRNSKRQIYRLPGGTERVINTKSTTVVDDIIHEICSNMLNVTDPIEMLEFSLYCIADGDLYTMPLSRDEYILDITTELIKNHQQYFLIFCRSSWLYPLRLDSKLYIEVIFNQIAPDYLEGLLLVLPAQAVGKRLVAPANGRCQPALRLRTKLVREIARVAALLHRASGTDYMPHKDEIKYLLPKPIIAAMKQQQRAISSAEASSASSSSSVSCRQAAAAAAAGSANNSLERPTGQQQDDTTLATPQKWIELVQSNWRDMSAFDTLDAKAQFLDIVRHWPLFGSSFFAIKFIQRDLIQPMDFILALNKLGIQMLDMSTHETVHKYTFNEVISTRKVRSEDGALYLDLKCGNLMKRTIIRIQTDQAHEISRLIRLYIDIELLQQKQRQQPSSTTAGEQRQQQQQLDSMIPM